MAVNISHFRSFFFRAAKLVVLLSDCERESGSESESGTASQLVWSDFQSIMGSYEGRKDFVV
jgi:hypothetical protein